MILGSHYLLSLRDEESARAQLGRAGFRWVRTRNNEKHAHYPFLVFSFLSYSFFILLFSLPSLFFPFLSLICSLFLFSNWLAPVVRMRSDRYCMEYIRGSLSWVASSIQTVVVGFSSREWWDVCTGMDLAHRILTPDFTFICFWWRHELRQLWYMRVPPWVVRVFP